MEDSGDWCAFIEGVRNPKPQTFLSRKPSKRDCITNLHICQTFICKVWALYTLKQGLSSPFLHKKISQNQGEIVDNRNLILRNQYQIFRNQDIMVCYFFLCPQPCGLLQQHIQLSGLHPHGQLFTIGIVVHILSPPQFLRALGKGHY